MIPLRETDPLNLRPAKSATPDDIMEAIDWLQIAIHHGSIDPNIEEFKEAICGTFAEFEASARSVLARWLDSDPEFQDARKFAMKGEF